MFVCTYVDDHTTTTTTTACYVWFVRSLKTSLSLCERLVLVV